MLRVEFSYPWLQPPLRRLLHHPPNSPTQTLPIFLCPFTFNSLIQWLPFLSTLSPMLPLLRLLSKYRCRLLRFLLWLLCTRLRPLLPVSTRSRSISRCRFLFLFFHAWFSCFDLGFRGHGTQKVLFSILDYLCGFRIFFFFFQLTYSSNLDMDCCFNHVCFKSSLSVHG